MRGFCGELRKVDIAHTTKCLGVPDSTAAAYLNVDVCTAWETGVKAGHVKYDSTQAAACLATYADRPCTGGSLDACVGVVTGTVAAGAACELARSFFIFSECAGDSECIWGPAATCAGSCVLHAQEGEPCSNTQPCTRDTLCDARTARCAPLAKAGEPCGIGSILLCATGLFCTDWVKGGTCMPQHPTGACQFPGECTQPAQCPSGGGVCGVPPDVGDACGPGSPGCGEQLICGPDQRCKAFSLPGESCTGSLPICAVGQCGPNQTCVVKGPGETCNGANAECGPNAFCVYSAADGQRRCTSRCL